MYHHDPNRHVVYIYDTSSINDNNNSNNSIDNDI